MTEKLFYTNIFVWGNSIFFKGYRNGERYIEEIQNFKPEFFMETNGIGKFTSLDKVPLRRVSFDCIKEARGYLESVRNSGGEVYGNSNFAVQFLLKNFKEPIDFDFSLLRIGYVDIEVKCENGFPDADAADQEVNCIVLKVNGKRYIWSLQSVEYPDAEIKVFNNDTNLLQDFANTLVALDLDILSGFNIRFYDIPYLVNRMANLGLEPKDLSPFGYIKERSSYSKFGKTQQTNEIMGITILDMRDLFTDLKFAPAKYEQDSLNFIANTELEMSKKDYSDYGSLREFYTQDFQKYVEYCVEDVDLVERLEAKRKLIRLVVSIAYEAKIPLETVFFATKIWETICYDYLYARKIICKVPQVAHSEDYVGGYNKETVTGFYRNIVSFDATSLYPSIIRTFNISPDTLDVEYKEVECMGITTKVPQVKHLEVDELLKLNDGDDPRKLVDKNPSPSHAYTANGAKFSTVQQGIVPILITNVINARRKAKSKMQEYEKSIEQDGDPDGSKKAQVDILNVEQSVKKVLANSFYGCLGTPSFVFYDHILAGAVTETGQLIIRTAEKKINALLNKIAGNEVERDYVIHIDTDSLYIALEDVVDKENIENKEDEWKFLTQFCNVMQEELQKEMEKFAKAYGCKTSHLSFKKEIVATTGFFGKKKRYALDIVEKEGIRLAKPKEKITGYEPVRTTTPLIMRDELRKAILIILRGKNEELIKFIDSVHANYRKYPLSKIAKPTGCNNLEKYASKESIYMKGTPYHVKAALVYNHELAKRGHRVQQETWLVESSSLPLYLQRLFAPSCFLS